MSTPEDISKRLELLGEQIGEKKARKQREEEERRRQERDRLREERRQHQEELEARWFQQQENCRKAQPLLADARELGDEEAAGELQAIITQLQSECGDIETELGYEPGVRRQQRQLRDRRLEQLRAMAREIADESDIHRVVEEVATESMDLLPSNAMTMLDYIRGVVGKRGLRWPDSAEERIQDLRDRFGDAMEATDEEQFIEQLQSERQRREERDARVMERLNRLFQEMLRLEETFPGFSREQLYCTLGALVTRARILQDSHDMGEAAERKMGRLFSIGTAVSKDGQPGFIRQLRRDYSGNLHADLFEYNQRLRMANRRALEEHRETTAHVVDDVIEEQHARGDLLEVVKLVREEKDAASEKALKERCLRVLRRAMNFLPDSDDELLDTARGVYQRWGDVFSRQSVLARLISHMGITGLTHGRPEEIIGDSDKETINVEQYEHLKNSLEGWRAVVLGGTPRPFVRETLEDFFGLVELAWPNVEWNAPRRTEAFAHRVRNGSYDIVFLIVKYIGHHVVDAIKTAASDRDVPVIFVREGYGLNGISGALDASNLFEQIS